MDRTLPGAKLLGNQVIRDTTTLYRSCSKRHVYRYDRQAISSNQRRTNRKQAGDIWFAATD
jgi:hypothetical protein